MPLSSSTLRGALYALSAYAVYSSHDVIVKLLGKSYSPIQIIFFSVMFGLPLVLIMLIRDPVSGHLRPKHPWWSLTRTLCALVSGFSAFYAFTVLPLTDTYAILFATPLLITLLSIPILGEKVGLHRGLAVAVGLCGVLVVLRPGVDALSLGHIAGLTAASCSAMTSLIVRRIGKDERAAVLVLYPMMTNFVVMGALLPSVYRPMPLGDLALLATLAAFSFTGMLLVIAAYRTAEAVTVAPMQYSQMIWAVIFGYAFFDESPDGVTLIGSAIIIASGLYIVLREGYAKSSNTRPVLQAKSRPETGLTLSVRPSQGRWWSERDKD